MSSLVDLSNPSNQYFGTVIGSGAEKGLRLQLGGKNGCVTSVIRKVVQVAQGQYYIMTKNSSYILTRGRSVSLAELQTLPTLAS